MLNKTPEATRRTMLVAGLGASILPGRSEAMAAAEGAPGPGKILVWVDERHWRALISAGNALGRGPG